MEARLSGQSNLSKVEEHEIREREERGRQLHNYPEAYMEFQASL